MLSAIMWDNDGVLVNTEHYYFEANRTYLRRFGIELTEEQYFEWFLCADRGAWHLLDPDASPEQIAHWRCERNAIHLRLLDEADSLITPGIEPLLEQLAGHVDMGIVTSATRESFSAIHRKHDLLRYFRFALTAETYDRSKPHPAPYLRGIERIGKPADQCLVVEDSPRGLQAALSAGLRCIILRHPLMAHHDFAGAWCVVNSTAELLRAIEALR